MKISLIVAMATNRVIGKDNGLIWHLPNDLRFFKTKTMGKPMIMGRNTFDSIGKPLPGRTNIVITRDTQYAPEGVVVTHSLEEALTLARTIAEKDNVSEIMIIGGAQIYEQSCALADRLYVTQVHAVLEGDAFFPEIDQTQWREVEREDFKRCEKNPFDYSFVILDKK
jgi:dihydrofolate reductase